MPDYFQVNGDIHSSVIGSVEAQSKTTKLRVIHPQACSMYVFSSAHWQVFLHAALYASIPGSGPAGSAP